MDDSDNPTTIKHEDSSWTVIFYRYMNGYKVYVDKPLRVGFDSEGRALWMEGRRRPILEESDYPTRSPTKALEELKNGNWLHLYITDLSPAFNENIDQFIIKEIEIAYHEQHPGFPKQVLQPYYIFRNQDGQALYVPAIDDPFVE